jgi:hypothetical protein
MDRANNADTIDDDEIDTELPRARILTATTPLNRSLLVADAAGRRSPVAFHH